MSQAVGHLREATKALTGPKMKAGFISSATKLPARNFSDGVKTVRPLACRSAVAFWLAAKAAELLPTKSSNPKTNGTRRIIALPAWLRNVDGKECVPYSIPGPYTLFFTRNPRKIKGRNFPAKSPKWSRLCLHISQHKVKLSCHFQASTIIEDSHYKSFPFGNLCRFFSGGVGVRRRGAGEMPAPPENSKLDTGWEARTYQLSTKW